MAEKIIDEMITVECLGSGFAAVHRVLIKDDEFPEAYWDVQQTGFGRFNNSEEAEVEAKSWSESDGIRLSPKLIKK